MIARGPFLAAAQQVLSSFSQGGLQHLPQSVQCIVHDVDHALMDIASFTTTPLCCASEILECVSLSAQAPVFWLPVCLPVHLSVINLSSVFL